MILTFLNIISRIYLPTFDLNYKRLLLVETSQDMKSYYLQKLNLGFEWFKDRKAFSILVIDLLKYEKSLK